MKPLVSTVIIFRDAERFFTEAIASVIAQTYEDWELLLVDDGSSDGSTEIALQYAAQYPRQIRYLHHPHFENRGMSASRNLGVRNGKGSLIAFLDADDVWLPEKLKRQVEALCENEEAGLVCGPTEYWYSWTGFPEDQARDKLREVGGLPNTLARAPRLIPLLPQDPVKTPATCSILLRKGAFELVDGFEEGFRGLYEDQAFFAKIYLKTSVLVLGDCLDRYRQHGRSCCAQSEKNGSYHSVQRNAAHLAFLRWLRDFLVRGGYTDPALWQPLRRALWPYEHPVLNTWVELRKHPVVTGSALARRAARRVLTRSRQF